MYKIKLRPSKTDQKKKKSYNVVIYKIFIKFSASHSCIGLYCGMFVIGKIIFSSSLRQTHRNAFFRENVVEKNIAKLYEKKFIHLYLTRSSI